MPPALFLWLMLGACERRAVGGGGSDPGEVVARVNGKPLYQREFDAYLPQDYQRVLTSEERRSYLDRWVVTDLLYEAAMSRGVGMTPEIQSRVEQLKKDLIAEQLVQAVIRERAVVPDEEARAYYERHIDEYTREYRVSHILVNTREEAEEARHELQKRPFAWVERRMSLDKHTGIGGDLGFLSKGNMIPEFEPVVFRMNVGEISDVIESEFGYHIIQLTDAKDARSRLEYADVAEDIARILLLQRRKAVYDSLVTTLYHEARIELVDADLRMVAEEYDTVEVRTDPAPFDTVDTDDRDDSGDE